MSRSDPYPDCVSSDPLDPRNLVVEPYADFGTSEPWVARTMLGILEVAGATRWSGDENLSNAVGSVFEALAEAFNDLRALRELDAREKVPVTERDAAFSAFYRHLWTAYKDRFQNGVPPVLGYKIGFLFASDRDFEAVAAKFLRKHPELDPAFVTMLGDERRSWQSALARFRNDHLEHRKKLDPLFVAPFYTLATAELAFENVWQAIEDITVQLLVPYLPPGISLVEIPEAHRDAGFPKRFGFRVPAVEQNREAS